MPSPGRPRSQRLSRRAWLDDGYRLLSEEGPRELKIARLCKRLAVTKGSFYWHFRDIESYKSELIDNWISLRTAYRITVLKVKASKPRDRLFMLMNDLARSEYWIVERAMREWARHEPTIDKEVRASDKWVIGVLKACFRDSGFGEADSSLRASITLATGIGFLEFAPGRPPIEEAAIQGFLDVMLR